MPHDPLAPTPFEMLWSVSMAAGVALGLLLLVGALRGRRPWGWALGGAALGILVPLVGPVAVTAGLLLIGPDTRVRGISAPAEPPTPQNAY